MSALDSVTTARGMAVASGDGVAGRMLPVGSPLADVLPWQGLRRGSTVVVRGSTSLLTALLASATAAGSWAAVVGLPGFGMLAAAEAGVAIERLALVPRPGPELSSVAAALIDGVDLVALAGTGTLGTAEVRKLTARARQRGSVLIPLGPWPSADVELRCVDGRWHGLGMGHGHLTARDVEVRANGRGAAARPRAARMYLPGPGGPMAAVTQSCPALGSADVEAG